MSEKLFRTDGVRGPYDPSGEIGKINGPTFELLAYAAATKAKLDGNGSQIEHNPVFVVGGDTRTTSPLLIDHVATGAEAAGAEVLRVGAAPTPALAWLAQTRGINAIAVTASHNPDSDNGFKLFRAGGRKADRKTLDGVEEIFWNSSDASPAGHGGSITDGHELLGDYLDHLVHKYDDSLPLDGKLVVIDGANGAASNLAPSLFARLGAGVVTFACDPDKPINQNCGAEHLEGLKEFLQERPMLTNDPNFLGGFAFDGDADRVMGVDRAGNVLDGNHWMRRLAVGQVGIVGTIYTNTATRLAVEADGVEFHSCDNGDSYVTQRLIELTKERGAGFTRGGEATGHLIDMGHLSSGDGMYMGLKLATELAANGQTLQDVSESLKLWPEVKAKIRINGAKGKTIVQSDAVQEALAELPSDVQVILRESGTEPIIRVHVEAQDPDAARETADKLSTLVSSLVPAA